MFLRQCSQSLKHDITVYLLYYASWPCLSDSAIHDAVNVHQFVCPDPHILSSAHLYYIRHTKI